VISETEVQDFLGSHRRAVLKPPLESPAVARRRERKTQEAEEHRRRLRRRRRGKAQARAPPADPPAHAVFYSIEGAARTLALSEWSIKDLLRQGKLRARKSGRRTLIEGDSVREYAASLPPATFSSSKRAAQT
jgi:excisionase family DNA binding protein